MVRARRRPGRGESFLSLLTLLALLGIGIWIFSQQFKFNPAVEAGRTTPPEGPPSLAALAWPGLRPLGDPERFSPEILSDKINGKAEVYLSAGFVSLTCQRFSLKDQPGSWLEMCVYDMAAPRQALAVLTAQRRPGAQPLGLGELAYQSQGSIFFTRGRYYVEIIVAATEDQEAGLALAQAFVRQVQAPLEPLREAALFPQENLIPESFSLIASDAFGFEGLNDVLVARYRLHEEEVTAFVSRRASGEEAAALAQAYHRFLIQNSGVEVFAANGPAKAWMVKFMDSFDLVFTHGPFLAGVHQADSQSAALEVGVRLAQSLVRAGP